MKTLILNGSPRKSGDTTALICAFTRYLQGEYKIVDCYTADIAPCIDCRSCREKLSCPMRDTFADVVQLVDVCDKVEYQRTAR